MQDGQALIGFWNSCLGRGYFGRIFRRSRYLGEVLDSAVKQ